MEALLGFLKDMLSSQPLMQVFVGGGTFLVIAYMVTRATKDKNALPPVAAPSIADVPPPFLQGPREAMDLMREVRDLGRRVSEDISRIAECTRIIREETKRQTEILSAIEREQAIENRAHGRDA